MLPQAKVALEYSPDNDIPYVSHVDAGTVDMLRSLGVEVVSSANLLQAFSAWTPEQLAAHLKAAEHVLQAKDIAFEFLSLQTQMGTTIRETTLQKVITDYFDSHRASSTTTHPSSVSARTRATHTILLKAGAGRRFQAGRCRFNRPLGQAARRRRALCRHHLDGLLRGTL